MNIGSFKSVNGQLLGSIATRAIDLPRLGLKPVESNNDRAPKFEVVALNPGRVWVQIGAVWEATNRNTGETFYQGRIDDPSMSEPLPIAMFRNDAGADGESFAVVWSRPIQRERDGFGSGKDRRRTKPDDSFGEGNATADGQLVHDLNNVDDDVPF